VNLSFFLCRAACHTRSSACDTLARSCALCVLCCPRFPWSPPLAPQTPRRTAPLCSSASQLLRRSQTSRARASPATALTFPMRASGVHPKAEPEISRFPRKELPHMPGSSTTPGRTGARDNAPVHVALRDSEHVGTRDKSCLRGSVAGLWLPCRRFADTLTDARARLGADVDVG
jgi:hypothetical protein